jgi:hypothetical protein
MLHNSHKLHFIYLIYLDLASRVIQPATCALNVCARTPAAATDLIYCPQFLQTKAMIIYIQEKLPPGRFYYNAYSDPLCELKQIPLAICVQRSENLPAPASIYDL